jgi:hypothetical protein
MLFISKVFLVLGGAARGDSNPGLLVANTGDEKRCSGSSQLHGIRVCLDVVNDARRIPVNLPLDFDGAAPVDKML